MKKNTGYSSKNKKTEILSSKDQSYQFALDLSLDWWDPQNSLTLKLFNQSSILPKDAIELSPGMRTTVLINRVIVKRLGGPYSQCETSVDETKYLYFQVACFDLCYYKKIAKICLGSKDADEIQHYFFTNRTKFDELSRRLYVECISNGNTIEVQNELAEKGKILK